MGRLYIVLESGFISLYATHHGDTRRADLSVWRIRVLGGVLFLVFREQESATTNVRPGRGPCCSANEDGMDDIFAKNILETKFQRLSAMLGKEVALYVICAMVDAPYKEKSDAESWEDYLLTIQENGVDVRDGFAGGVTDVHAAIRAGMSDERRWVEVWGYGEGANPYTEADYRRLDHLFATYSTRLMASGGPDPQQEFILRGVCADQIIADRMRDKGTKESLEIYAKLTKLIQDKLSSENLRKKDILPQQEQRVDGFVDALKRKYGVDARSMTHEQVLDVIYSWFRSRKYDETTDAADNYLLATINCTRRNSDMSEIEEVPKPHRFDARYNSEFADEPNEMEREAYSYLDLKRKDEQ